jgi:hypothetical protein
VLTETILVENRGRDGCGQATCRGEKASQVTSPFSKAKCIAPTNMPAYFPVHISLLENPKISDKRPYHWLIQPRQARARRAARSLLRRHEHCDDVVHECVPAALKHAVPLPLEAVDLYHDVTKHHRCGDDNQISEVSVRRLAPGSYSQAVQMSGDSGKARDWSQ